MHLPTHQGRVEIGSEFGHHCSSSQQSWLLLKRSSKEKPPLRNPAEEEERISGNVWHRSPEWWVANMDLVLDGVTLTKAPQSLSKREKHAAQAIKAMWMKKGEAMSPEVHTYNRYSCIMQSDMNHYLRATWPNHLQESDIAIGWAMLPFSCNSFVIYIRRVWGAVGSESSFMR